MAHKVDIQKTPVLTKDMRVVKGKYTYQVKCKHRACKDVFAYYATGPDVVTSAAVAQRLKDQHHLDMSYSHMALHPNDRAHVRTIQNKLKKASLRA